MYKLRASQFIDWYFSDDADYRHVGERLAFFIRQSGTGTISVEDLFHEQDEIPAWILDDCPDKDDYIGADMVELINDIV